LARSPSAVDTAFESLDDIIRRSRLLMTQTVAPMQLSRLCISAATWHTPAACLQYTVKRISAASFHAQGARLHFPHSIIDRASQGQRGGRLTIGE
jgi:hypothetical protein